VILPDPPGQDETLDTERSAVMLTGMQLDEVLRTSGRYGFAVAVPGDVGPPTQLLGSTGGDPCARDQDQRPRQAGS
jgi:hypothetical protein